MKSMPTLGHLMLVMSLLAGVAASADVDSEQLAVGLSPTSPSFSRLSVDSLGKGRLEPNPVLTEAKTVAGLGLDFHQKLNHAIRMTLDRDLAGTKGYGQIGYGCETSDADLIAWKTPWPSLDTGGLNMASRLYSPNMATCLTFWHCYSP